MSSVRYFFIFVILVLSVKVEISQMVFAQQSSSVLQGGVSMANQVPEGFFGTWKVFSVRGKTNNTEDFGESGVDIWNLSRTGDVITLMNPVSGAKASILVSEVNGDTVRFQKVSKDKDTESIETPIITLEGNNFYGIDRIVVKNFKNGSLFREDKVEYKVKAVKISGANLPDLFRIK